MKLKEHCDSKLVANRLTLIGTDVREFWDIVCDILIPIPAFTKHGIIALGVKLQGDIIYNRHKADLFKQKAVYIGGHSLGGSIGIYVAYKLVSDGYQETIDLSTVGAVKCLSKKLKNYLKDKINVEWHVRYRDPIPHLGFWQEPFHNTKRTGERRKHIFDWDIKEHTAY